MQTLFEYDQHIGDWRVLVQSRDIHNGAVQSRHIASDAVISDKIGTNAVQSRHISESAVQSRHIDNNAVQSRHIGDGEITGDHVEHDAVVPGKIANDAVATRNIRNYAVTPEKVDPDLLNQIQSAGKHGYALSNEFGDSTLIGVSQKTLTDAFARLWSKLEDITGETLQGISLTVTPDYFISETGCDVHITATTVEANGIFEHIAFYINGQLPTEADNTDFFEFDTRLYETSVVMCKAKILGIEYTRQKVVTHYSSFWLGAGSTYHEIMDVAHVIPITNGMRGAYDVTVRDYQHIFVIVGESLREGFLRADINGVEIPFTETSVTVNGNRYRVFTSESTFDEGIYNIDING